MRIYLKKLTGEIITYDAKSDEYVIQLKQNIQSQIETPKEMIQIVYKEKELDDYCTLQECGLRQEETVFIYIQQKPTYQQYKLLKTFRCQYWSLESTLMTQTYVILFFFYFNWVAYFWIFFNENAPNMNFWMYRGFYYFFPMIYSVDIYIRLNQVINGGTGLKSIQRKLLFCWFLILCDIGLSLYLAYEAYDNPEIMLVGGVGRQQRQNYAMFFGVWVLACSLITLVIGGVSIHRIKPLIHLGDKLAISGIK